MCNRTLNKYIISVTYHNFYTYTKDDILLTYYKIS